MSMGNFRNRLLKSVSEEDQSSWRGVFIEDTTGKLWETDDWDGSATFNSVAVITDTHSFGIAGYHSTYCDFSPNKSSSVVSYTGFPYGRTVYSSVSEAYTDMDGEGNTALILESQGQGTKYAAQICDNYTFANGKNGYLMAAGEYKMIVDNLTAINNAMSKVGGTTVQVNVTTSSVVGIWTSTLGGDASYNLYMEYNDGSAYYVTLELINPSFADCYWTYDYSADFSEMNGFYGSTYHRSGKFGVVFPKNTNNSTSYVYADAFKYAGCRPLCRLMKF